MMWTEDRKQICFPSRGVARIDLGVETCLRLHQRQHDRPMPAALHLGRQMDRQLQLSMEMDWVSSFAHWARFW